MLPTCSLAVPFNRWDGFRADYLKVEMMQVAERHGKGFVTVTLLDAAPNFVKYQFYNVKALQQMKSVILERLVDSQSLEDERLESAEEEYYQVGLKSLHSIQQKPISCIVKAKAATPVTFTRAR